MRGSIPSPETVSEALRFMGFCVVSIQRAELLGLLAVAALFTSVSLASNPRIQKMHTTCGKSDLLA